MKTVIASLFALSLLGAATAADAAIIGLHVGPVGVGIGERHHWHHWHHHYYRHYWHR